jgi:hypothetical protein
MHDLHWLSKEHNIYHPDVSVDLQSVSHVKKRFASSCVNP